MVNKFPLRFFALPVLILLLVFIPSSIAVSEDIDEPPPPKPIAREDANPNLQTVLQEAQNQAEQSLAQARSFARDKGITLEENRVKVIIEPEGGDASSIDLTELESLGVEVKAVSASLVRASVPLKRLEEVAGKVGGVSFVRLPLRPQGLKIDTSEGVEKTGAVNYQDAGFYGQGSDVAVIDLGFDHLDEAKDSGDLPPDIISSEHDYTDDNNIQTGGNHGTDVAEIVHDMAPEAQLHLMKVGDSVDLENAKDDALSNGIEVINHSVGWFNAAYYDGTGKISDIAADAYDGGIFWANSAGNSAKSHWQGGFQDTDGDQWGEFGDGDECNGLGQLNYGNTVYLYMTWNAWPSDAEDYDLYLKDGQGETVASSANFQNGSQPPTEYISYDVSSDDNYCFAIHKVDAPSQPELEVFVISIGGLEYPVQESSITDPANDEKVVAVGAISVSNWEAGPQEEFSSQGPTNDSKFASKRVKPDLMGPDRVSTSGYGTFYGTSASSPHIAGAAALLISENPERTNDDLWNILESNAVDMGATGKDNIYGWGRTELPFPETDAAFRVTKEGNVLADGVFYGESFESGSADLAEKVKVSESVEPGDVLALDPTEPEYYRKSRKAYSTIAAGVVSTEPGVTLGRDDRSARAIMALMGTVPVKATTENGPLQTGDLLTTSAKPGYAMVCENKNKNKCAGAIIGKALEPLEEGEGKIRMLVV